MERLSALVTERMGLHYPDLRRQDLERGVASVAKTLGFADSDACLAWLLEAPFDDRRLTALVDHLTIGETYFFRHPETFAALENQALPGLIARRRTSRRLAVWCAACSSGEEAYSVAIMLQRVIPDFEAWDISLIATDINVQQLRKAATGEYGSWSFRGVTLDDKARYFDESRCGWTIKPGIRKAVRFEYFNLANESLTAPLANLVPFDIIFCRNVLIYFSPAHIRRLMGLFANSLASDGWLVTSPVETGYARDTAFTLINFGGATLLYKDPEPGAQPSLAARTAPSWVSADVSRSQPPSATGRCPGPDVTRPAMLPAQTPPMAAPGSGAQPAAIADAAASRAAAVAGATVDKNAPNPILQAGQLQKEHRYAEALDVLLGASQDARAQERAALLARIYADLGDLDDALIWARKAVEADVVRADSYYLLSTIQMALGDEPAAMESLRKVVFLDPDNAMAHYALALVLRRMKRQPDSDRHLQIVLRILSSMPPGDIVPGSEGMSARSMIDMVTALQQRGR